MPSLSNPFRCAALLSACLLIAARPVQAQDEPQVKQVKQAKQVLWFLAGGAAGLVVHESGHIATGAAFGAHPGFKRLDYGVIPFFAVTHDPVSRRREYLISSSGFFAQHAANEWILGRPSPGPFAKGWLTFNLATSAVYAVAAFGRTGPPERDTRGMAVSAGSNGVPEPVVGVLIVVPAILDGVRYAKGDPAWARWSSRALKAGLVLLAVK